MSGDCTLKRLLLWGMFWLMGSLSFAQSTVECRLHYRFKPEANQPIDIVIDGMRWKTIKAADSVFTLPPLSEGKHTVLVYCLGCKPVEKTFRVNGQPIMLDFQMNMPETLLAEVHVDAGPVNVSTAGRLAGVEGMGLFEAKKTEVIELKNFTGNQATNNPRQVFAKVAGVNIWESDGAGLQLGIGARGLSPNRTAYFNVRQNGYDISADALGYPESYYTPPIEALDRIEVVRGAGSLQYGTQFGGMLNFIFRQGPKDKPIEATTRLTGGSFGLLNSFTSVGGQVGKVNYYSFYQYKRGNGWSPNSGFENHTAYGSIRYQATEKLNITVDVTHMDYLAQQAGGLTDTEFAQNPRGSKRSRNWFQVNWNLAAVTAEYKIDRQTKVNSRTFALASSRSALGILDQINRLDRGEDRMLIYDRFANIGNETRLLHHYRLGGNYSTVLTGVRLYRGRTWKKQGDADNGSGPSFKFNNPNNLEYSDFLFPSSNVAWFAENIFNISPRLSISPGIRIENITTASDGYFKIRLKDMAGNLVVDQKRFDQLSKTRTFPLMGLGISFKATENLEYYSNVSQNFRAVTFNDLRVVNPNFRVDSALRDEYGYNLDLGIRGSEANAYSFDISVFHMRYNGRIGSLLKNDGISEYRYRTNIADSRVLGLEAFGEINVLKYLLPTSKATLFAFATGSLTDARYINTEDRSVLDKRMELAPIMLLRSGLQLGLGKFSASLQMAHTARQFTDATNAIRTVNAVDGEIPAYTVIDFSSRYKTRHWALEAGINNLANSIYFTRRAEAYPGPGIIPSDGRSAYLGLQLNF